MGADTCMLTSNCTHAPRQPACMFFNPLALSRSSPKCIAHKKRPAHYRQILLSTTKTTKATTTTATTTTDDWRGAILQSVRIYGVVINSHIRTIKTTNSVRTQIKPIILSVQFDDKLTHDQKTKPLRVCFIYVYMCIFFFMQPDDTLPHTNDDTLPHSLHILCTAKRTLSFREWGVPRLQFAQPPPPPP